MSIKIRPGLTQILPEQEKKSAEKRRSKAKVTNNKSRSVKVYRRAALLGIVSGLRSMTSVALLTWTSDTNPDDPKKLRRLLQSPLGRLTTTAAVIGKDMADKLPKTPPPTRPSPFITTIIIVPPTAS